MPSPAAPAREHTCSAYSARLDEPLAGTAPCATAWVLIEQPGPWGARALTESRFDADLGARLSRTADGTGVRIGVIRRAGSHAAADPAGPRTVLVATVRPGSATLRTMRLTEPRELLDLDFGALGRGENQAGSPSPTQALLVCTNGKRDQCCAVLGRALARDLAALADTRADLDVWEADHLGGHRFAPTALLLPTGYLYGRLDGRTALRAVDMAARGLVSAEGCRGRSAWSRAGQAADLAVRAHLGLYEADAVEVVADRRRDDGRRSVDLLADGSAYRAVISERPAAQPRPESCGKAFGTPAELHVDSLDKQ